MGPEFLPSSNWLELTILCKGDVLYFNHLHGLCWHLSLLMNSVSKIDFFLIPT